MDHDRRRLGGWVFAIAWPGWQISIMFLGVLLVAWSVFGLLTDDVGR